MPAVGFGTSFGLIILENPGIYHKISPSLALKLFLESFYTWMKVRSWSKPHTFQSTLHMLSVVMMLNGAPEAEVSPEVWEKTPSGEKKTSGAQR